MSSATDRSLFSGIRDLFGNRSEESSSRIVDINGIPFQRMETPADLIRIAREASHKLPSQPDPGEYWLAGISRPGSPNIQYVTAPTDLAVAVPGGARKLRRVNRNGDLEIRLAWDKDSGELLLYFSNLAEDTDEDGYSTSGATRLPRI